MATSVASQFSLNDVETPKVLTYNREHILKNIEESRLARESSNFDDYLRKDYALQGKYFAERVELPNGKRGYLSADIIDGKPVPVRSRSFVDAEGHIKWPDADGFVTDSAGNPITQPANLKAGQMIDRYGGNGDRFTSPLENGEMLPYTTRGLPYPEGYQPYHKYEVVKDINKENYNVAFNKLSDEDKYQLKADMEYFDFTEEDIYNPQRGKIAKVFGAGGGTQIQLGTSVKWYQKLGFLKEVLQ